MSFNLEGDGLCTDLFEALWTKDELNFGPSVNIPDTIVYKFGQPVSWYFTGIEGKVKKKNKHNVVNAKIYEGFTKQALPGDIVAFYISTGNDTDEGVEDDPLTGTLIEYFDRENLHEFLYNRWKQNTGILQRFVEPKGTKNTMIRALWSPKVCLLERRTNNRNLHDLRYGVYERAVTYEGPDYHSQAAPLRGSVLPERVQAICGTVVAHVAEVSFQKQRVCRMVLNFKADAKDRLWLLWSSSLRLSADADPAAGGAAGRGVSAAAAPLTIDPIVRLPGHLKLNANATYGRPAAPPGIFTCVSCARASPEDQRHPVPYKTVVAHFEQVLALLKAEARAAGAANQALEWPPPAEMVEAAGGVGFGTVGPNGRNNALGGKKKEKKDRALRAEDVDIPPVLRALHPRLTADSYARHRRDPLFLYKAAQVCEDCYLVYADYAAASFGTQPRSLVHMGTRLLAAKGGPGGDDYLTPWGAGIGAGGGGGGRRGAGRASAETWQPVGQGGGDPRPARRRRGAEPRSRSAGDALGGRPMAGPLPGVPGTIRTSEDAGYAVAAMAESWQQGGGHTASASALDLHGGGGGGGNRSFQTLGGLTGVGTMAGGSAGSMPDVVGMGLNEDGGASAAEPGLTGPEAALRQRERQFLDELARNPKLPSSHPLVHMISGQQQQKAQASGYNWENELTRTEQQRLRAEGVSPYGRPQVLVEYVRPGSLAMAPERPLLPVGKKGGPGRRVKPLPNASSAAQKHLDFLAKTIDDVSRQVHGAQQLQQASSDLRKTRQMQASVQELEHPNQELGSGLGGMPSIVEEGSPAPGGGGSPGAGKPKKGAGGGGKPRVLLSVAKRMEGRFLQCVVTEEADRASGAWRLGLSLAQPATGERWQLRVGEEDLGLGPDRLAALPEEGRRALCHRVLDHLAFVGRGDEVGVAFQHTAELTRGIV